MGCRATVVHEDDCERERWGDAAHPGVGQRGVTWRTLLSADRTPTTSLTLGVAEIEPGAPAAPTCHRHAPPEAYYVVSGVGVVVIDGREQPVRAGSAVFVPPRAEHAVRNTGSETLRLVYAFPVASFADVEYEFPER